MKKPNPYIVGALLGLAVINAPEIAAKVNHRPSTDPIANLTRSVCGADQMPDWYVSKATPRQGATITIVCHQDMLPEGM